MKKVLRSLVLLLFFVIGQVYAGDPVADQRNRWIEAFNSNSLSFTDFYTQNHLLMTKSGVWSGNSNLPSGLKDGLQPIFKIIDLKILDVSVQNSTKRLEIGYYVTNDPVMKRAYLITGWDRAGKSWLRELDVVYPSGTLCETSKNEPAQDDLDRTRTEFCAMANRQDVSKTVRILFNDDSIIWDNGRISQGEQAIAVRLKGMTHSGFYIRFRPKNIYFIDSETVFETGQYEILVGKSYYAFVWKKQPGGDWKVQLFFGYTSFGG